MAVLAVDLRSLPQLAARETARTRLLRQRGTRAAVFVPGPAGSAGDRGYGCGARCEDRRGGLTHEPHVGELVDWASRAVPAPQAGAVVEALHHSLPAQTAERR
jgi:hypothetical protein